MSLVEAGWDAEVAAPPARAAHHRRRAPRRRRPHRRPASGSAAGRRRPPLPDLRRDLRGVVRTRTARSSAPGASTRLINRRLRRALEHRDRCCVVPGCGATRGLHAHHIEHWEDGGHTELDNLVLVCPYHHRLHHRGVITITGPADHLVVTDSAGRPLSNASLARPPTTPPPAVTPSPGPSGERADWWWYQPFQPQPPPTNN